MFLVKDKSKDRELRIVKYLEKEPALALIMATIHFEWTIQRAIISLSKLPNKTTRDQLKKVYGIKKYKECWKELIANCSRLPTLPLVIQDWKGVLDAFEVRNQLVHGKSSCSTVYASPKVMSLINASKQIRAFCEKQNIFLDSKLKIKKMIP